MPVSELSLLAGSAGPVAAVLFDGEGTLVPARFLQLVLVPYARRNLGRFLEAHREQAPVVAALRQLHAIAPGAPPVETLEALMDRDARLAPLRSIQALLWEQGFARGDLRAPLHSDAMPLLRLWREAGIALFAAAAAGEAVQRLMFRDGGEGDAAALFSGFFDSRSGFAAAREAIGVVTGGRVLFMSDAEARLDAAALAGFATCRVGQEAGWKPERATASRHQSAAGLRDAAALHGLPL